MLIPILNGVKRKEHQKILTQIIIEGECYCMYEAKQRASKKKRTGNSKTTQSTAKV